MITQSTPSWPQVDYKGKTGRVFATREIEGYYLHRPPDFIDGKLEIARAKDWLRHSVEKAVMQMISDGRSYRVKFDADNTEREVPQINSDGFVWTNNIRITYGASVSLTRVNETKVGDFVHALDIIAAYGKVAGEYLGGRDFCSPDGKLWILQQHDLVERIA